jgi:predicted PurR-regulated permease PerM
MKREQTFLIFALFLTSFSIYLLYRILSPFLEPIFWAILLVIAFYPLFHRIRRLMKRRAVLPAMIMTVIVILVIVIPFSLLMVSLANEAVDLYHSVEEMVESGRLRTSWEAVRDQPIFKSTIGRLMNSFGISEERPLDFLLRNLQQVSTFLFNQTAKIFKGLSTFVIGFFFTLLSLYYLFKDGDRILRGLREILPLPVKEKDLILQRFKEMVYATIYGGILVAMLQGLTGGLIFWILGISSPILWGTAMALLSFIPIGGTALVWAPAAVVLFIQGAFLKAVLLLFFGALGIGMIDNLLRPVFISKRTKIHPLLLFFSVLGGIDVFGLIGLVVGPLVATLFLTLIEIYIQGIQ